MSIFRTRNKHPTKKSFLIFRNNFRWATLLPLLTALWVLANVSSCTQNPEIRERIPPPRPGAKERLRAGYTIQVGAFRDLNNAVRLAGTLSAFGLKAYYFKHQSGLYKVRFGNYTDQKSAQTQAESIRAQGVIQEFYIIKPETTAASREPELGTGYLRNVIVSTAQSYVGVPYQWGGTSAENGFDCSGLTMAVYDLAGLSLPRSSRAQFATGTPVAQSKLRKGDLVFFRTTESPRISHVGIYTGGGSFIHAPGKNKEIRVDRLTSNYFRSRYAGARTFLNE